MESWTVFCFRLQQLLFGHTVFVTPLRTAVKRALAKCRLPRYKSCFALAGSPPRNIFRVVAGGLFGLCGQERLDELLRGTRYPTHPTPSPVPNKPYGFCGRKAPWGEMDTLELWSCAKVAVASLGSPSLISLMVSVDVKQH